jgi:hypothetical protein
MDAARIGSGLGAWLRNSGQIPAAAKHKSGLYNFTHCTPEPSNFFAPAKVSVRSLCQFQSRGLPYVTLARVMHGPNFDFVENQALPLHPPDHAGLPGYCFYWGSQSLRSGDALGGPGEPCVKFGGK